jgi:hypothetical protein
MIISKTQNTVLLYRCTRKTHPPASSKTQKLLEGSRKKKGFLGGSKRKMLPQAFDDEDYDDDYDDDDDDYEDDDDY